jgi:pyrimidine operon attenuation protein/uracil phosphoribosyltransferase
MSKLPILKHEDISLKLDRIAWQILEDHYGEQEIIVVGIQEKGNIISNFIVDRLRNFSDLKITSTKIGVDKEAPLINPVDFDNPSIVSKQPVVLVDDVLNSGITMAAAVKEILKNNPKSLKVAVLANRDHHKFPVQANFVGISMATTLKEHITFQIKNNQMSVWLD